MRAPDAPRWSVLLTVRQPEHVRWLGWALAVTAAGCVAVSLSMQGIAAGWCVLSFLVLTGALWFALQKPQSDTQLAADASGRWALRGRDDAAWHAVALTRFWRGPFWLTLTLAATDTPVNAASGQPWTLTVWRSAVSADDWRILNVLLRTARPPRRARQPQALA